ncbi:MAG: nitroreductase family protein [Bacteroidales bacterium]|jgi:nitroreductase|nr:nitroreductase family protein [Bacteroidales bacterium]MDD3166789.1 nitroreductase family protein [Bacteroidales bacterium]HKL93108.1 nitroreductase family protein [Bacteroidales bacterium]
MDFQELVKIRQSVRSYVDTPVEKEKIVQCLEAARLSPSANNAQSWKFVVIDRPDLKEAVAECASGMGMNKFTHQSPVLVAVVLERSNLLSKVGSLVQNKEYALLDIGMAVNQFCLQAADLGLGTCILGWFNESKVKKLLNVPLVKRIPLLISVGYAQGSTRNKVRKSMDQMSSWNTY